MMMLAHIDFPDWTAKDAGQFGLIVLVFASLIPACVTLLTGAWSEPGLVALSIAQIGAIIYLLRVVAGFFRRRGLFGVRFAAIMYGSYFVVCLSTNVLWFLGLIFMACIFH